MSTHPTSPGSAWHPALPENDPGARAAWRSRGERAALAGPRRHVGRVLLVLLALLLLCAALIWVSLWLRPGKDTALVLLGAGYEDNLAVPHNVYGTQGLQALAELGRVEPVSGGGRLRLFTDPPRPFNDLRDWDRDLARVQEKNILLFIAAHG